MKCNEEDKELEKDKVEAIKFVKNLYYKFKSDIIFPSWGISFYTKLCDVEIKIEHLILNESILQDKVSTMARILGKPVDTFIAEHNEKQRLIKLAEDVKKGNALLKESKDGR